MSRTDANLHHVGIFGRRLSGKTTLAIKILDQSHRRERRMAVVLDPKAEQHTWGPHCYVIGDRARWLSKWQHPACLNCNIVWEESSSTIKRDADMVDIFTAKAGAHGHRLFITGHSGTALLPVMREQITEIFLFRQTQREAEMWADLFTDERIIESTQLDFTAREVLHAVLGTAPHKFRLKL